MKYEICNYWNGMPVFEARIDCALDSPESVKRGLALRWALKNEADLSEADLSGADLSEANLIRADLRGADLSEADLSGAGLSEANLIRATLREADLSGADLSEANLIRADLSGADLSGADLSGAGLRGADLSEADLSGAKLPDAPVISDIHRAVYAAASQPTALNMGAWHKCETTHCRAGWTVHLAGDAGYALEDKFGTNVAAAMIYQASDPKLKRVPDWYATNEDALADMKKLAGVEE